MKKILTICFAVFCFSFQIFAQIPTNTLVQIIKAEDELRFDNALENLLSNKDAKTRARAALAVGRIGNEKAIPALVKLLENDSATEVRTTAAFVLGEIESIKSADAILRTLKNKEIPDSVRARAIEAAGKIAAANAKDAKAKELGEAILDALQFEERSSARANRDTILLGLTAVLRARPEEGDFVAAKFLTNMDARIRADAANTLSRLRAKNANEQLRAMLLSDENAIARANAARALGASEDKEAFNLLLDAALTDEDSRVRVSTIRSLGNLKDAKAADKLLERAENLLANYKKSKFANPVEKNELLEIATALSRLLPNSGNKRAIKFLSNVRLLEKFISSEIEISFARISPNDYLNFSLDENQIDWRSFSSHAQGLAEIANLDSAKFSVERDKAVKQLKGVLVSYPQLYTDNGLGRATPDILRAFTQFKTIDLSEFLRDYLSIKIPITRNVNEQIFIRATAAELLGEQPATKENVEALKTAFVQALQKDKDYNDAQLAILSALVKLDKAQAVSSLKLALDAPDFLVRRHAAQLIKQNDLTKSFPNVDEKAGTVKPYNPKTKTKLGQVLNTNADYVRALSRKNAKAILTTEKGTFTIEFSLQDAPLTVDNFIKLAKSGYFNNVAIHRVVPNFVMQDGDPRGDGNGGPGWQIRDEINMLSYERGAVGMALSGKDTGGSQWFVTHSPQPHLDGGYTIFGRVNLDGMKIVDNLVRGDKILSVKIVEGNMPRKNTRVRKNN